MPSERDCLQGSTGILQISAYNSVFILTLAPHPPSKFYKSKSTRLKNREDASEAKGKVSYEVSDKLSGRILKQWPPQILQELSPFLLISNSNSSYAEDTHGLAACARDCLWDWGSPGTQGSYLGFIFATMCGN